MQGCGGTQVLSVLSLLEAGLYAVMLAVYGINEPAPASDTIGSIGRCTGHAITQTHAGRVSRCAARALRSGASSENDQLTLSFASANGAMLLAWDEHALSLSAPDASDNRRSNPPCKSLKP